MEKLILKKNMIIIPCVFFTFYTKKEYKLQSFFIDQDTALRNDEVLDIPLGQLELMCSVYDLYCYFTVWIKNYGAKHHTKKEELFHGKLIQIIGELFKKLDVKDERVEAIYRLFGKYPKLKVALPIRSGNNEKDTTNQGVILSKTELFYAQFVPLRTAIVTDPQIKKELKEEFDEFCTVLLNLITSPEDKETGNVNRKFIGKLIEYIGHCGSSTDTNSHIVKYLLTAFAEVIEMSTHIKSDNEKDKRRAQKTVLRTLDSLKLTKTILNLLCAEESERLNSIMPLLLRLANKMLTNALPEIQNQFYTEFQLNSKSERLFERMHGMISRNIFIYYRHPTKFAIDFQDTTEKTLSHIDVQAEIMKLLKSLCENHNVDLQYYMVNQKYSKTKYCMISIIVDYLHVLVQEIHNIMEKEPNQNQTHQTRRKRVRMSYKHAVIAISALTEFVQGPCKVNQEVISDTLFFMSAQTILELKYLFDDTIKDYQQNLLEKYKISKLKRVCGILLLSLLEQRKSEDSLVVKMRQCIPENIIQYNTQYVYFAFMKESDANYTEDLLFPVFYILLIKK